MQPSGRATGAVPAAVAGLLAACVMILTGMPATEEAYRAISWTTVVLIAGMIPLSTAMMQTGAAEKLATGLLHAVGDSGPRALIIRLFVLTAVLGR